MDGVITAFRPVFAVQVQSNYSTYGDNCLITSILLPVLQYKCSSYWCDGNDHFMHELAYNLRGLKTEILELKTKITKVVDNAGLTLFQRCFNAVSTLFQRCFNAVSTLFQRRFNAVSTPFQRRFNAVQPTLSSGGGDDEELDNRDGIPSGQHRKKRRDPRRCVHRVCLVWISLLALPCPLLIGTL